MLAGLMQEQHHILHETETCRPEGLGLHCNCRARHQHPAGHRARAAHLFEGCTSSTGIVLTTGEKPLVSAFKAQTLMEQSWQPAKRKLPAAARARMVPCREGAQSEHLPTSLIATAGCRCTWLLTQQHAGASMLQMMWMQRSM